MGLFGDPRPSIVRNNTWEYNLETMFLSPLIAVTSLLTYDLGSAKLPYTLTATFDGFIPILGGQEGKVDVKMLVNVSPTAKPLEGNQQASLEIGSFAISFNGAVLPLGIENVTSFFPKTTIQFDPTGKVTKTDAKKVLSPVRLPGLDPQRLPEISFLPIEFPSSGIEIGSTWTFKRQFSGADLNYVCKLDKIDGSTVTILADLDQAYENFEDEGGNIPPDKLDAVRTVKTELKGKAVITYSVTRKLVLVSKVDWVATSKLEEFGTKEKSERKLALTMESKLDADKGIKSGPAIPKGEMSLQDRLVAAYDNAKNSLQRAWMGTKFAIAMASSMIGRVEFPWERVGK